MSTDAYTSFDAQKSKLFMSLIESMVKSPDTANFCRRSRGLDLEIAIMTAAEDEHVFTPEVCQALGTILSAMTGITKTVVYLEGKPHRDAKEAIDSALSQV